jgi:peptidoglycan-associated lipoprotein
MKSVSFLKLLTVSLALAFSVIGCKKSPRHITPISNNRSTAPGTGNASGLIGQNVPADPSVNSVPIDPGALGQSTRLENFIEDRDTFKDQTVYFDYDSATLKPSEKSKVDGVATYLKSNPTAHIRVEGHCDERGTEEYNRSLGERRAGAGREALVGSGIPTDRVSTISYGEDKPAVAGHDESAWTKNRRAEFVLLKPRS